MPTTAECAAYAGVTVANMKLYFKHFDVPVSLNVPGKSPSDGKEGGDTLQMVVCPGATPEDILNETAKGDALTAALKTLTQEQFMIIDLLYGLTGEKPLSIHMTCQKTKISKDKIRQIRDKALAVCAPIPAAMGSACKPNTPAVWCCNGLTRIYRVGKGRQRFHAKPNA